MSGLWYLFRAWTGIAGARIAIDPQISEMPKKWSLCLLFEHLFQSSAESVESALKALASRHGISDD